MMFFYVDESGNTGTNLFDENQPHLYYGVLSARKNLDALAKPILKHARRQLGVERLHASELGLKGLVAIAGDLVRLQKRYRPRFDIYRVAKPDHAVITFFDQVFDQGMNPAMTWTGYWTPIRYALLVKVAMLFDHELSRLAWRARINTDDRTAEEGLVNVCRTLLSRLPTLPDARSRQVIGDTLRWAIENVGKLNYNCKSPEQILDVTPNMIGFQSVMHGIASRLACPDAAASITVDRQSQFNKAQQNLAAFFAEAKRIPWLTGVGLPEMDLSKIPETPIVFLSGEDSAGLELVDCYLWILKRAIEGRGVARELLPIVKSQVQRGNSGDISLDSMARHWSRRFEELPEPTEEQLSTARELLEVDEERRLRAVNAE